MQESENYYKELFLKNTLFLEHLENDDLGAKEILYTKTKKSHQSLLQEDKYIVKNEQFLREFLMKDFYERYQKAQKSVIYNGKGAFKLF